MTERLTGYHYAGISLRYNSKILLLKNKERGTWELPGGKVEETDQTYLKAALREFSEETGLTIEDCSVSWVLGTAPNEAIGGEGAGLTFGVALSGELPPVPQISDEHSEYGWWSIKELPEELNEICRPGMERWLFIDSDLTQLIQEGVLLGPNTYFNQTFFPMRITGTGSAMRVGKMQFTFRKPGLYLNPEFMDRCNGLQVLWQHADKDFTDGSVIQEQSIGTICSPYVRGDELWGVAKILDLDAADAISTGAYSTSPSFLSRVDSRSSSGGVDFTEEGQPLHLDHLAVVQMGVWDKLGDPSGIDSPLTLRPIPLSFLKEYNKVAEENETPAADSVASESTQLTVNDVMTEVSQLKDLVKGLAESMKLQSNKDSLVEPEVEVIPPDAGGDESPEPGTVAVEDTICGIDSATFETAMRAKDEVIGGLQRQVDELVNSRPKELTDEDRNELDEAVREADSVFTALGRTTPAPMNGELSTGYRRRTAKALQALSPRYNQMDLSKLDSTSMKVMSGEIYKDAVARSRDTSDMAPGTVVPVRRKAFGGREITEWRGSTSPFLAPFRQTPRKAKAGTKSGQ